MKAINEKGRMIRLPSNKSYQLSRIERARQLTQNNPYRKLDEEIQDAALFLDMVPEKVNNLVKLSHDVISLDVPVTIRDSSLRIKDFVENEDYESPDELVTNSLLRDDLEELLKGLDQKDAEIIRCRFGLGGNTVPMTLQEVGDLYNLSKERIRQIEQRALLQLQRSIDCTKLNGYLAS